jgi:hypothetical protein
MSLKEEVMEKGAWYLKWRTQIWSTVFFLVGVFGGNADRIVEKVPTLQYTTPEVQQKLNEYNELKEKLIKMKKELDELQEKSV